MSRARASSPATSALNGSDWAQLREQVATVQAQVRRRYDGATFDLSVNDLALLQRLIDDKVYDETQVDELRAMGVVLGNVLEKQLMFEWVVAEGRDREPALKLKAAKPLLVYPLRMIRERVVSGEQVDLTRMYRMVQTEAKQTRVF